MKEKVISKAEFDRATAEFQQTEAQLGEIKAVIQRKTIKAPFSGVLGIRQVNLGQYLAGGDALVTLQALNPIYVNFGVPQQSAGQIPVGRVVKITTEDAGGLEWSGRVTALDSMVDEATRNIQVQATLPNPDGKLRPGMFVQAEVVGRPEPVRDRPAGLVDQLRAVRRLGVRRRRSEGRRRQVLSRRPPAARQGGAGARRSGRRC